IKRVVYISSSGVYGSRPPIGRPLNEDDPTAPVLSGYVAKRLGEIICEEYNELYDLDCLTLRYGGQVYGPRLFRVRSGMDTHFKDLPFYPIIDLFEQGALGKACTVSKQDIMKPMLSLKDCGRAAYMALTSTTIEHRLFNTSGILHSNRQIAELVKKYAGCTVTYEEAQKSGSELSSNWKYAADFAKSKDAFGKYAFDFSRAKAEFGWEPIYDIEEAVLDWVNYQRRIVGMEPVQSN
ncbi:MAG: NAD(P)-dependent oxidoreductase, partial [Thaumarchaeota archaeon]|nr:NAD(P)-dependent oxidoreductase [Nitrososphaerota archaeon]